MTQVMAKGSNIELRATAVQAVLRWSGAPAAPDIDASALLLGADGRVRSDDDFVFYNQPRHPSGLVRHRAKTRDAEGLSDTVEADLSSLDPTVDRVMLTASADGGTFGEVGGGMRLLVRDAVSGTTLASFDFSPETGAETAMICGELYRRGSGWKFRALGQGYSSGLVGLATAFGVSVDESVDGGDSDGDATHVPPPRASGAGPVGGPGPGTVPEPPHEPGVPEPEPVPPPAPGPPPPAPGPVPEPEPPGPGPVPQPPPAPPEPPAYPPVPAQHPLAGPQPAYGYPQPVGGPAFTLPPQGPQFASPQG
ncbi:hypothetical protein GCM10023347_39220 [Streptomyces chumphonensis]|uniref:TerD family protein n=1 Tax=Streptomyces chumphonensis TaxID=1214925 RepID=A0A927EXN1_9ACTN|nr:TerD family protein [Streptomyces chumphonensis]MBD3930559.1 TerD family protein [Streptomyces chumphonensis]